MEKNSAYQIKQSFSLFLLIVIATSCAPKETPLIDLYGKTIEKQMLYTHQKSQTDSLIQYSFYLPNSYNGKDPLPVLFFFDPQGNGSLPLKNYQSVADKYGYILIGSNNIRNGLPGSYTFSVFQQLLKETESRFLIDGKKLFLSGFSGGAKLAIVFAQQHSQITGVIACGATIPMNVDEIPKFYFTGVIGKADFNYLDVQQTFSIYDQSGFDYTAITFSGKHQWPPLAEFDLAVSGLELFCMKTGRAPKKEKWMNFVWAQMKDSLKAYEKKQDYISEMLTLRQMDRWFNGMRNINDIKTQQEALVKNPQFVSQVNKRQGLLQKEILLRGEYIKAIDLRDLVWWKAEVNRFKETTKNPDKEMALIGERLLNYLSMVSFMLSKNNLDADKLDDAFKKIQIYELVDPANPDVFLMYARYYLLRENQELMAQNFKKALNLGFNSWETYANDHSWNALFENESIRPFKNN